MSSSCKRRLARAVYCRDNNGKIIYSHTEIYDKFYCDEDGDLCSECALYFIKKDRQQIVESRGYPGRRTYHKPAVIVARLE